MVPAARRVVSDVGEGPSPPAGGTDDASADGSAGRRPAPSDEAPPPGDVAATFETVEWSDTGRPAPDPRTTAFAVAVLGLGLLFAYDRFVVPPRTPIAGEWDPASIDWLFYLSLLVATFYLVVPLYRNRPLTRYYWDQLRTDRLAVASLAYLGLFVVVGALGPVVVGEPSLTAAPSFQPPAFASVPSGFVGRCAGPVVDGRCHGTLAHPFGTAGNGYDVLVYVVGGMRVALEVALVTATLLVPLATAVGTVAAHFGGWVDEVLMRYVDVQQVVPPFFVYIIAHFVYGGSLLLFVTIFGVLNWGGIARLVRSEALQKNEAVYVAAARSAGAGRLLVVRRHLVPNVSSTVVTAVTLQVPTLILFEATVSFLDLAAPGVPSWGNVIANGMQGFPVYWWIATVPAAFVFATVVSFNLLGDALRDVLDPRGEE